MNDNRRSPAFHLGDQVLKENFTFQAYKGHYVVAAAVVEVLFTIYLGAVAAGDAGENSFFYGKWMVHFPRTLVMRPIWNNYL